MALDYNTIEAQLVEQLPELRPAVERYWQEEGPPGEDAGPYILFENLLRFYVDVLLDAAPSPKRDYLLRRAFEFAEACVRAGGDLHDLAAIALFESQSKNWFARADGFMGTQSRLEAQRFRWPVDASTPDEGRRDAYGVRALLGTLLAPA